jgi:hypothetical protein
MASRTRSRSKGGSRKDDRSGTGRVTPKASSRYTPPVPKSVKVSPRWLPVLILTLLVVGILMIIINYLGVLPGGASNWYLLIGLALIAAGFIAATQYR